MKPLGPMREHYWLLQDMARITGIDLSAAQERGAIGPDDWVGMVRACRDCDWVEECRNWMREAPCADVAPHACRNRVSLAVLRIDQELAR